MLKKFNQSDKAMPEPSNTKTNYQFPGVRAAMDGNTAAIMCERESSDAAGAYPITPSTQMGEYWAEAAATGHLNISNKPLIFIEPEGEHAAAAVTAGLSMTGLRSSNFSSGQGVAYMHESLYAAVGKRLTYVLNIGARAITKATLNVHAGHDDYHCVDDTGFFQLFAKNAQHVADLNIIAHYIAEHALNPGIIAQDGFLTTHLIESMVVPERELIETFLGKPDDIIETPTPAQRIIFGDQRRRVPELWDVDNPVMAGIVQNQDSYMQSVAAQRPFFFDHIQHITDQAFEKFYQLTGRHYARVMTYRCDDAEYIILGQGSVIPSAEVVADYLRESRKLKVGVINLTMFRPFPSDLLSEMLKGKKGVAVLERLDQPLASDLPLMREIRATMSKSIENGYAEGSKPWPELATYKKPEHIPQLYSGSFGLGSRDLQAEGIIAAIENMLPKGKQRKQFYLGINFLHDQPFTPKQEIYQQTLQQAYPRIADLAIRGSENPNLMPDNSITVRMHSVGGWGAITTGKNLAMTLFELLGYHIKANPKYGSEKKGQPTTYYLSAAPEPIRMNCEYFYVDVVISPDPNVFNHTNALAGLKDNGVFIIQSEHTAPQDFWDTIPANYQKIIIEKKIKVAYVDAFKIAREEATDPDLQLRMQGTAFQGAFFAASPVMQQKSLTEETLLKAIRDQLQHKFGYKGARVVEDNVRVVKRGFDEIHILPDMQPSDAHAIGVAVTTEPSLPIMLKRLPQSKSASSDIHRFWEQTGNFYLRGKGSDNLADPFMSMSLMPAVSAVFRDMTTIRFEHPQWIPENCTACGDCYTTCPDTAIPGLVNDVTQILDTIVARVKRNGHELKYLPKAVRIMEKHLRQLFNEADEKASVSEMMDSSIETVVAETADDNKEALRAEFELFQQALNGYQFALTRPYYTVKEKKSPGSGGLFSLTINPYTCKGCQECIQVCNDDALRAVTQTKDTIKSLRDNWNFWLDLPTTPRQYIRIDNLEERIGSLQTMLLDKEVYTAFTSGDGACMGCSEKTIIHLFTATVDSLMQPRVARHVEHLTDLIQRLERHIELKLVQNINVDDTETINQAIQQIGNSEITLAGIAKKVESLQESHPIDPEWIKRVVNLVSRLKQLKWKYTEGITGKGRTNMGIINSTGCSSVWGSTFPFNPYPFPWANHLFQDSPSMAMGIFEGHMAKMAEGFKAVREAELELAGNYNPTEQKNFFRYFTWQQFSDEEFALCPPVVAVGGDGAMYDIGFQNLSRMLMSGKPIKALVLDTQVYSNTGGQACTSGFTGQVSDMAPFGKVTEGKQEIRKEIGLIAMAHRTAYVMQSTIAHANHMIEGFIEGLLSKRPAVFNCYSSCQPEHGIGDDMSHHQAKLAVESRAYPMFQYNPDKGEKPEDCFELTGNPAIHEIWPKYKLHYLTGGKEKVMELPMTFADFAMTETRFRKHFRSAPPDTWHEDMLPLADYLDLSADEREGKHPFIWTVDRNQNLSRLLVDDIMVASCEDRRHFWVMLKAIAGIEDHKVSVDAIENKIRQEIMANVSKGLMQWIGGGAAAMETIPQPATTTPGLAKTAEAKPQTTGDYMAPWIDTEDCTACDECTNLNPNIFAYNDNKQAYIKDPNAGTYKDLVKAAERCTAQVIHPGLPRDRSEKDIEQWIKRGEKYN
ncbi:2-oxoacid:acceptor oxidoreductase family protein [Kaarinaea lacus]